MKIKLFFESANEFAEFILSVSSIHFGSKFQEVRNNKRCYDGFDFLELVPEIEVCGALYSIATASSDQKAKYTIINYMLNDAQIKNDSAFVLLGTNLRNNWEAGSKYVLDCITELPESFVLRVGWRTDYREFLFKKQ